MADSFSCGSCADIKDYSSESNLSLSVGCYPCEDTFSYENTFSCDNTSSKGPSIHFVPPVQGTWRTENIGRLLRRRGQIQDDLEQFCKLRIPLAWDVDMGSNDSGFTANWGLHGDNQWIDQFPREETHMTLSKLDGLVQQLEKFLENQKDDTDDESMFPESFQEKDFQLSSSSPPDMAQVSHQEHETCQELPNFDPKENEDVIEFLQIPPWLQEREHAEVSKAMPHRQAGDEPGGGARSIATYYEGELALWVSDMAEDNRLGKWQPKDKHYRNRSLIRSAIRGRHSFQYTSPLLSELPVGLPLAKAANSFLIWGKRAPQEYCRTPPSADTKEKTLS